MPFEVFRSCRGHGLVKVATRERSQIASAGCLCGNVNALRANSMTLCWEKETIHRPAPLQNFSYQKKIGVPQRQDFGAGYGFPG